MIGFAHTIQARTSSQLVFVPRRRQSRGTIPSQIPFRRRYFLVQQAHRCQRKFSQPIDARYLTRTAGEGNYWLALGEISARSSALVLELKQLDQLPEPFRIAIINRCADGDARVDWCAARVRAHDGWFGSTDETQQIAAHRFARVECFERTK